VVEDSGMLTRSTREEAKSHCREIKYPIRR
jgi:hypothetical protein